MKKGCYAWLRDTKYNFEKYKGRVEEATKLLQTIIELGNIYQLIDDEGCYYYLIGYHRQYIHKIDDAVYKRLFRGSNAILHSIREDEHQDLIALRETGKRVVYKWGASGCQKYINNKQVDINDNEIKKETKKERKHFPYGVYGMYYKNELVYIGMTMRDFSIRWEEHKNNIIKGSKELKVYEQFKQEDIKDIQFKCLINCRMLKTNSPLTRRDVESMELAMINLFKPKYNYAGIGSCEYKYSGRMQ